MEAPIGYIHRDVKGNWYERVADAGTPDDWKLIDEAGIQYDLPEPGAMARVGRGFQDVLAGGEQLFRRMTGQGAEEFEAQEDRDLRTYEEGRGEDAGFDWLRLGGNVAAMAPAALIPGGQGLVARTAIGAGVGAGSGASLYTPTDTEGDFATNKFLQSAGGAAGGAIGGAVAPWVTRALSYLPRTAARAWRRLSPRVQRRVEAELASNPEWSGMGATQQAAMLDDAMKQLDVGDLDPEALFRRQNLERYYDTPETAPTTAQITRDPKQWQFERNLSKVEDVGDDFRNRYVAQNQRTMQNVDELAESIGPEMDPAAAGEAFRTTAREMSARSQRSVGEAYRAAEALPGADDLVASPVNLRERLLTLLDENEGLLPKSIERYMNEFADETREPTVREVTKVMRLINRQKAGDPNAGRALREAYDAFDSTLDDTSLMGSEAAEQIKSARALAAQRFGLIRGSGRDKTKYIEGLIEGTQNPDKVVDRMLSGNSDDLNQVKRFLLDWDSEAFPYISKQDGARLWDTLRAGVLRRVLRKAGYDEDPSRQLFSGIRFKKALDQMGDKRLNMLYSPEEVGTMREMAQAITDMTYEPPFSAVNASNTGAALTNLIRRVVRMPGLAPMMEVLGAAGTATQNVSAGIARQRAASAALSGQVGTEAQRLAREQYLRRVLGSMPATGAAAGAAQQMREFLGNQ